MSVPGFAARTAHRGHRESTERAQREPTCSSVWIFPLSSSLARTCERHTLRHNRTLRGTRKARVARARCTASRAPAGACAAQRSRSRAPRSSAAGP
eukprot:903556-Rhodomonas_salina.8